MSNYHKGFLGKTLYLILPYNSSLKKLIIGEI
jgi:hypothetical protein